MGWVHHLGMDQRKDLAKVYRAHRAGLTRRLMTEGHLSEHAAEQEVLAWEAEAERRNLDARTADWWAPAWGWMAEQRESKRRTAG